MGLFNWSASAINHGLKAVGRGNMNRGLLFGAICTAGTALCAYLAGSSVKQTQLDSLEQENLDLKRENEELKQARAESQPDGSVATQVPPESC